MSKKRYQEAEVHKILEEHRNGSSIQRIIEKYGISQATFYNWRARYGNLSTEDMVQFNKLKEENEWLKRMFADVTLENMALKATLEKMREYNDT
ncbi:MAG: transposase [Bacteroidales bacterium]